MRNRYMVDVAARRHRGGVAPRLMVLVLAVLPAAMATAQPNLVVRVEGEVVANNTTLNFGEVPVGNTDSQIVVVLRNEGNEDLIFTESPPVAIAGGFPDQFDIIQPALEAGNKLSPNASTAYAVRFTPTLPAEFVLFTHTYVWTNASATPFHLVFNGTPTFPQMTVSVDGVPIADGDTVDFPDTLVGNTRDLTVDITNEGSAPLELVADPTASLTDSGSSDFSLIQLPDPVVDPGATTSVVIRFGPTAEGEATTELLIPVNEASDSVNGTFNMALRGQGDPAPLLENPADPDNICPFAIVFLGFAAFGLVTVRQRLVRPERPGR